MSTPTLHHPDCLYIDHDPGFFDVSLLGAEKRLDVFEQNNKLFEIEKAHAGRPPYEVHAAVAAHLQQLLGLATPPSHAVAARFVEGVLDRVEQVKKKLRGPPTSPSPSPDSTPSTSPEASAPPSCSTPRGPSPAAGSPSSGSTTPGSSPS